MSSETLQPRYIPKNVLQGKRIMGFKYRNIVEGAIDALIVILLLLQIPFVLKVKLIVVICIGIFVFFGNCFGIKDQAISEFLLNFLRYRNFVRTFHYRRLNHENGYKPAVVEGKVITIKENKNINAFRRIMQQ